MDTLIASGTKIVGVCRNYHDATSRDQPESLPKVNFAFSSLILLRFNMFALDLI